MSIQDCQTLVIYLDNKCNFNCTYCDRDYIKSLGGQSIDNTDQDIKKFFEYIASVPNNVKHVSFHGGEPLLFAKKIDSIMQWLLPICQENDWMLNMTTNGSLVKKHEWLFEKYPGVFSVTVSYDFSFQIINREEFDVIEMAKILNKYAMYWIWQFVLPIDRKDSFSFKTLDKIVNTCYTTGCKVINLLVLRHRRGQTNFDVIIDKVDLNQFFAAFIQFIEILYVKKIKVHLDGSFDAIDKAYFSGHQKMILGPDGYIYPEFEFLEYKKEYARTGRWKGDVEFYNPPESIAIRSDCMNCESKSLCGLKYLHKMFDTVPSGNCKYFYKIIEFATRYLSNLNRQKTLVDHIGINEDFKVRE